MPLTSSRGVLCPRWGGNVMLCRKPVTKMLDAILLY